MAQHIGIVGCSAEGAALCYKTICIEAAALMGPHAHPEISIHTPSLSDYVTCLEDGDLDGVAALMAQSASKLASAGADFLICPDNTVHQAYDLAVSQCKLPWLHIAEVVAREAKALGYKNLGLLGTRWLVESKVYSKALSAEGLTCHRPSREAREEINRIIMDDLVMGRFPPEAVSHHRRVIEDFKARGCDAVVLGCTEIPLIIGDHNSALPVLDSTRLLARAALKRAIG